MTADRDVRHSSLDSIYEEVLELMLEARDILADKTMLLPPETPATVQFEDTLSTSRLTTQLIDMLAWILTRKAVHAGEMTPEEAKRDEYRLSAGIDGITGFAARNETCSRRLSDLMDRSATLFARVARLDEMVGAEGDGINPAGSVHRDQ